MTAALFRERIMSRDPDNPPKPGAGGPNPASTDAFMRALEAFQKGDEANNPEQMEAAALKALELAAEEAEKNPSPSLVLKQEAGAREARGDWAGAEACYRKVLALEEATGNDGLICKAHYDLSRLFLLLGELDKAEASARAATAAVRQGGHFPLLVMALENEATCALRREDYARALAAASQAVAAVEPGRMFDRMRAGALMTRARCRLPSGDLAGAESDLEACKPLLLDRELSPFFAGLHSRVAIWWELTAAVRSEKSDLAGACEAWAEAVKSRRHVASLGHVAGPHTLATLARALRSLGEACDAAGKPDEGKAATAEAERIWSELGLPESR